MYTVSFSAKSTDGSETPYVMYVPEKGESFYPNVICFATEDLSFDFTRFDLSATLPPHTIFLANGVSLNFKDRQFQLEGKQGALKDRIFALLGKCIEEHKTTFFVPCAVPGHYFLLVGQINHAEHTISLKILNSIDSRMDIPRLQSIVTSLNDDSYKPELKQGYRFAVHKSPVLNPVIQVPRTNPCGVLIGFHALLAAGVEIPAWVLGGKIDLNAVRRLAPDEQLRAVAWVLSVAQRPMPAESAELGSYSFSGGGSRLFSGLRLPSSDVAAPAAAAETTGLIEAGALEMMQTLFKHLASATFHSIRIEHRPPLLATPLKAAAKEKDLLLPKREKPAAASGQEDEQAGCSFFSCFRAGCC